MTHKRTTWITKLQNDGIVRWEELPAASQVLHVKREMSQTVIENLHVMSEYTTYA